MTFDDPIRLACHPHEGAATPPTGISGGPRSGAEGNRTPDLNSAIVALYQLSYSPGGDECIAALVQRRSQSSPCAAGPHEFGR